MNAFTLSEYLQMPNLSSYPKSVWVFLAAFQARDWQAGTAYKPPLDMTLSEVLMMRKN